MNRKPGEPKGGADAQMALLATDFFFFFFTCSHKRGRKIQTSDIRFMGRDPQPIELLIENSLKTLYWICATL